MKKKLNFNLINKMPKVSQTFISLEGEGINVGEPSWYIRFAGCYSAACQFCDTKFSWFENDNFYYLYHEDDSGDQVFGNWISPILDEQKKHRREINRLTITGGEPLHYIESLNKDFVLALQHSNLIFNYNINIKWLGIESNGNLLQNIDIVLKLIQMFKIFENSGIQPQITISPKLNAETCYNNYLTQKEVNNMYYKVISNIEKYCNYPVYYKFIWNVSEYDNKLVLDMLKILKFWEVENKRIFLMPFTPVDPLGKNREEWEKNKMITARDALKFGIRFSPRLHIDLNLD